MRKDLGKLAIILGAGASYDCADPKTAASIDSNYRPPLAKDIFSQGFDHVLSYYPLVQARLDELRTALQKEGSNFEIIFRELLASARQYQTHWQFHVPRYLAHLFWIISRKYVS